MYEITNEDFTKLVAVSKSWADLARRCGKKSHSKGGISGNITMDLKLKVKLLGLDTSHFLKNGSYNNRPHLKISCRKIPNETLFVKDRSFNGNLLKKRLFEMGWKNECVSCKNVHYDEKDGMVLWQGKELILQIEHKNGVHSDNRIENLELICPLCHSQTSTYSGRNWSRVKGKPTPKRETVDDLELSKRIRQCDSWIKVCTVGGGYYTNIFASEFRRRARALGLDFSHFNPHGVHRIPDQDYFASDTKRKGTITKQRLLDLGWPNECAGCKNACFVDIGGIPQWMDKEIVLQVEHMNGVNTDNRLENLELLCYNCHSQTDTFTAKNHKKSINRRKWLSNI
jgi:5-methylcytosine-specific restriction endonuclease McrA